jgi:hypothetical protein
MNVYVNVTLWVFEFKVMNVYVNVTWVYEMKKWDLINVYVNVTSWVFEMRVTRVMNVYVNSVTWAYIWKEEVGFDDLINVYVNVTRVYLKYRSGIWWMFMWMLHYTSIWNIAVGFDECYIMNV